jgi:hemerythrin-like domain-containing protein
MKLVDQPRHDAIRIIGDEHRSLAAVLHGLLYLVRQTREHGAKPDFKVLGAMLYYIDAVPERFHHPKEDKYLFALLRIRCPAARAVLDQLQAEHVIGADKIRHLAQALTRYENGGSAEFEAFAAAVESYAEFHWQHMRREERDVLPLAQEHLTAGDWDAIDAAFTGHTDPLFREKEGEDVHKLFQKILNLAPPPIGVGPPAP